MNLLIVESPEKALNLRNILDKDKWHIIATKGYIEDLPDNEIGVYIKDNKVYIKFCPIEDAVDKIKKELSAENMRQIYIATDPDREGEGIAYQIKKYIPKNKIIKRVRFYELTPPSIFKSIENAEDDIDYNLANAQIARRVIDRLIGFHLTKKIRKYYNDKQLTVGRVQSPTVFFIKQRVDYIKNYRDSKTWQLQAVCSDTYFSSKSFICQHPVDFIDKQEATRLYNSLSNIFTITNVSYSKRIEQPPKALNTVGLQKLAYQRYGFTPQQTMGIAQSLYTKGYCTYIRTSSEEISDSGRKIAEEYITKHYGSEYYDDEKRTDINWNVKEPHECIRLTSLFSINDCKANDNEKRLLHLIGEYFYASQMKSAVYDVIKIELENNKIPFTATGERCIFEGFRKLTGHSYDSEIGYVPHSLQEGQKLLGMPRIVERKLKKPAYFNYATLLEVLSKNRIGRPSSYASILENISRYYVRQKQKGLITTSKADKLIDFLNKEKYSFLLDSKFTNNLEKRLDDIAEGKENKDKVIIEISNMLNQDTSRNIVRRIRRIV